MIVREVVDPLAAITHGPVPPNRGENFVCVQSPRCNVVHGNNRAVRSTRIPILLGPGVG